MRKITYPESLFVCATLIASAGSAAAGTISLPGSVSVPSASSTGTMVTLNGTFSGSDSLTLSISGEVFLQSGPMYGVNAAGVVITAGNGAGVGQEVSAPDGPFAGDTFGAVLVSLNGGAFKQIFAPDVGAGLGSSSPPTTLTFSGLASALFGSFGPVTDPTLTFVVADDLYSDNTGSFTVSSSVPEPSTWAMMLLGFAGLGFASYRAAKKISCVSA